MIFQLRAARSFAYALAVSLLVSSISFGQSSSETAVVRDVDLKSSPTRVRVDPPAASGPIVSPTVALYFDPVQGSSSVDLVRRALASNGELAAARLDVERARARLRQAGLRPNPSVDIEQTTDRFTGAAGERETSIGVSVPLELGGKRSRRIDLAKAEVEAAEAEIANRERQLANEVRTTYAEALAALRELQITENLNDIDIQTARFVQTRVNEGESAPIELNLLRVEVDRLRSRRALVEGRLKAELLKLKVIAGLSPDDSLRL